MQCDQREPKTTKSGGRAHGSKAWTLNEYKALVLSYEMAYQMLCGPGSVFQLTDADDSFWDTIRKDLVGQCFHERSNDALRSAFKKVRSKYLPKTLATDEAINDLYEMAKQADTKGTSLEGIGTSASSFEKYAGKKHQLESTPPPDHFTFKKIKEYVNKGLGPDGKPCVYPDSDDDSWDPESGEPARIMSPLALTHMLGSAQKSIEKRKQQIAQGVVDFAAAAAKKKTPSSGKPAAAKKAPAAKKAATTKKAQPVSDATDEDAKPPSKPNNKKVQVRSSTGGSDKPTKNNVKTTNEMLGTCVQAVGRLTESPSNESIVLMSQQMDLNHGELKETLVSGFGMLAAAIEKAFQKN